MDHKKQEHFRGTSSSASLTMLKYLTLWITKICGKLFKRWEYQTTLPTSWEICIWVKKQQIKPNMDHQAASKLGMEYIKIVYCHPAYLTCMQSTWCEILGPMKYKLESRFPGEISITSDRHMAPPLCPKVKSNWRASWWN